MKRLTRRETLVGAGLVLLAGCGGGGSPSAPGSLGQAPSPTPTPTPTPTPPPTPNVGSFGTLGATTSQAFATLGYSVRGKGTGWDFIPEAGSLTTQPGHAIRLAAPSTLLLSVPGLGEGELVPRDSSGAFVNGERTAAFFKVLGGLLQLSVPIVVDRLQKYVMRGYFVSAPDAQQSQSNLILEFGYGVPTAPNTLPASGTADYQTTTEKGFTLRADFGAKTVTGTIPFLVNGPSLATELRDVTISADGTSFSGRLIPPDGSAEGIVNGLFMGPAGAEFLAQAVLKSGQSVTIFSGIRAT